jgi:hypothetical protein
MWKSYIKTVVDQFALSSLIFSMPVITHSRMSMSVSDMSLRGWHFQRGYVWTRTKGNDSELTLDNLSDELGD